MIVQVRHRRTCRGKNARGVLELSISAIRRRLTYSRGHLTVSDIIAAEETDDNPDNAAELNSAGSIEKMQEKSSQIGK